MNLFLSLIERVSYLFCRHEWVRDRRDGGELALRCIKCMKQKEHTLAEIIRWRPDYVPIEPAHVSELPPPLQPAPRRHRRRAA